jgi:hypothetical protein
MKRQVFRKIVFFATHQTVVLAENENIKDCQWRLRRRASATTTKNRSFTTSDFDFVAPISNDAPATSFVCGSAQ